MSLVRGLISARRSLNFQVMYVISVASLIQVSATFRNVNLGLNQVLDVDV